MRKLFILALFIPAACISQERPNSIEVFGAFTTSSKLFPLPNDPDEMNRSLFLSLNNIVHGGVEIRRSIGTPGVQVGLGAEYIQKIDVIDVPLLSGSIPVRDGYHVVPLELTGYFVLPIGNETIQVYMGGGGGMYIGTRLYEYPTAPAQAIDTKIGFGIHILSGMEYSLTRAFSLRSEIKFRDVQFEAVNQFTQPETIYNGSIVPLDQTPFSSRLNIDGMMMRFGLAYHF